MTGGQVRVNIFLSSLFIIHYHFLSTVFHCTPHNLPLHSSSTFIAPLIYYHCAPHKLPLHPSYTTIVPLISFHCTPLILPLYPFSTTIIPLISANVPLISYHCTLIRAAIPQLIWCIVLDKQTWSTRQSSHYGASWQLLFLWLLTSGTWQISCKRSWYYTMQCHH